MTGGLEGKSEGGGAVLNNTSQHRKSKDGGGKEEETDETRQVQQEGEEWELAGMNEERNCKVDNEKFGT